MGVGGRGVSVRHGRGPQREGGRGGRGEVGEGTLTGVGVLHLEERRVPVERRRTEEYQKPVYS